MTTFLENAGKISKRVAKNMLSSTVGTEPKMKLSGYSRVEKTLSNIT